MSILRACRGSLDRRCGILVTQCPSWASWPVPLSCSHTHSCSQCATRQSRSVCITRAASGSTVAAACHMRLYTAFDDAVRV